MKKTAALVCAVMLTLTACGNDDDDKAKENIKAELQEGGAVGTEATEEQAECLSSGMVDDIGTEKLTEYGFLTKDLEINDDAGEFDMDKGDAETFAGLYTDCIDVEDAVAKQAAGEGELTAEQEQCITDAIDEDTFEAGLAALFQGETDEAYSTMQGTVMQCVTPTDQPELPSE